MSTWREREAEAEALARSMACPWCGAAAQSPCVARFDGGKPLAQAHGMRLDAARAARRRAR